MRLFIFSKVIFIQLPFILFISCSHPHYESIVSEDLSNLLVTDTELVPNDMVYFTKRDTSDFEKYLLQNNFLRISDYNQTIEVNLKYATTDNFMHRNMYGNFREAYLQKEVALKLISAQHLLERIKPKYHLIIYDAVRPMSVQALMWDSIEISPYMKYKYLSNPKFHSLHNYGAAVDVSIVDGEGNPLDMGTPFDCFCELAYPYFEKQFLKNGTLTSEQYQNRLLLRKVMQANHFSGISTEWWHFNYCSLKYAKSHFPLIRSFDVPELLPLLAETAKGDTVQQSNLVNTLKKDTAKVLAIAMEQGKNKVRFKVQIKTSTRKIATNNVIFKRLKVWRYYHDGLYKYTVGNFSDLNKALEYRDEMRQLGFTDCFVAAFNNEERITIKDAFEILEE